MQVVLLERVEKLGQMGEVVTVKNGFGRNYLLPQGKALRATKHNLAVFEAQKAQLEARNAESRAEAQKVAESLDGKKFVMIRQAGDSGQLFGSVTPRDIADAVNESGAAVERRYVMLDKPVKELGLHDVRVRLHPEVDATITINVARSTEEAELQAQGKSIAQMRAEEEAAEEAALAADFEGNSEFDVEALFEDGAEPDEGGDADEKKDDE